MLSRRPGESGPCLSGTDDTRTSTLSSLKSSPGSKPIKAIPPSESPSADSPLQSDFSQSWEAGSSENLFNSTFRLTPERVWKPKRQEQLSDVRIRLSSAGRRAHVGQFPISSERKTPIIQSRRIIRTARNLPKGLPPSLLPSNCDKYDLLLPPRFKK